MKTNIIANAKTTIKAKSPEILAVAGIATSIAAIFTACKATPKISKILDKRKSELEAIEELVNDPEKAKKNNYDINTDPKKDKRIINIQTAVGVAKELLVPIALETTSILCFLGSHKILKKRTVALTAACNAAVSEFKKYRKNVIERFNETVDNELLHSVKSEKIDVIEPDENGKEKKVKKTVNVADDIKSDSIYSVIFDAANSKYWSKDPWENKHFIKSVQKDANAKLIKNGYIFLNDVRKMLGLQPTIAGQVVGWIWDPEDTDRASNVDFGLFNSTDEYALRFLDGYENVVMLDFNVDGVILDDLKGIVEKI